MKNKIPSNSGENLVERDKHGRLLPGSKLNPAGPKPGYHKLSTKVRALLEEMSDIKDKKTGKVMSFERLLLQTILKKAIIDEDTNMIKVIWNYLDGMPLQAMDLTSGGKEFGEPDAETKAAIDKRFKMNMGKK